MREFGRFSCEMLDFSYLDFQIHHLLEALFEILGIVGILNCDASFFETEISSSFRSVFATKQPRFGVSADSS